jgi:hypothetical protein
VTGSTHVQGQTQGVRGFLHLQMLLWRQAQVSFPSHRPGNRGVHTVVSKVKGLCTWPWTPTQEN